jgi:hypothetical protein
VKTHLVVTLTIAMSSLSGLGQMLTDNSALSHARAQSACEEKLLLDSGAKEVLSGGEYITLRDVAKAFRLKSKPRLYFFAGGGNSYYIAGSLSLDGRGKILMSKNFVELLGGGLAFKGGVAHEIAHLVVDVHGDTSCDQWVMRDPKIEEAADALAATKVGFGPLKVFLSRGMAGITGGETEARLRALEKLEAQENGRR